MKNFIFVLIVFSASAFAQPTNAELGTRTDSLLVWVMNNTTQISDVLTILETQDSLIAALSSGVVPTTAGFDSAKVAKMLRNYYTKAQSRNLFVIDGTTVSGAALIAAIGKRSDGKEFTYPVVERSMTRTSALTVLKVAEMDTTIAPEMVQAAKDVIMAETIIKQAEEAQKKMEEAKAKLAGY